MKEEELNDYLKELMLEKANEKFTDCIMDAIELENKRVKQPFLKRIQGKSILVFLFILFTISLVWTFYSPGASSGYFDSFSAYLHVDQLRFNFKVLKFSSITSYAIVGLFIFLWLDILFLNKKRHQVS